MDSDRFRHKIREDAAEIVRLHSRVHETFSARDHSPEERAEWEEACAQFHARYDTLAFPGGFNGAYERIVSGDPFAMEAAICFVEVRPYFFRSGYMFKDILRKCKRAPLSPEQKSRLDTTIERYEAWRRLRRRGQHR